MFDSLSCIPFDFQCFTCILKVAFITIYSDVKYDILKFDVIVSLSRETEFSIRTNDHYRFFFLRILPLTIAVRLEYVAYYFISFTPK